MTVTTAKISQAASLLGDNSGMGGNYLAGAGSIVIDHIIDQIVKPASIVGGLLPEPFDGWIRQAMRNFHEVLTALTGNSSAIGDHIAALLRTAGNVAKQSPFLLKASATALACWQGPGADSFQSRIGASGVATAGVAGVLGFTAERHLVLAGQQADAKRGVIRLVTQLAGDLVQAAIRFLAQMGVSLAMGGWDVASHTIGGAASGAWNGVSSGWKSGGFAGAVGGFFSGLFGGGSDGFQRGVAEAKARIQAAFNNFVSWAIRKVGEVLRTISDFVKRYVENMVAVVGQISGAGVRATRAAALLRGRADPLTHAHAPGHGTYGRDSAGTGPRGRDGALIQLNLAIGKPDAELPAGYRRATPADLAKLGLSPSLLVDANGLKAEVFVTPDGTYVMAFAGTGAGDAHPHSLGAGFRNDAIEDAIGGGTMSPQTGNVLRITEALQRSGHADDVVFTGHSLGGRLATVAALDTGNAAVTYDAAGVSKATVDYLANKNGVDPNSLVNHANDGQIRRYYAGHDPLTAAQERWSASADSLPDAIGRPIPMGPINHNDLTSADVDGLGYGHGHDLTTLEKLWKEQYGSDPHLRY